MHSKLTIFTPFTCAPTSRHFTLRYLLHGSPNNGIILRRHSRPTPVTPPLFREQPDTNPGDCWAMDGTRGYVTVQLSLAVMVTSVSLEHTPQSITLPGSRNSAPKDFIVMVRHRCRHTCSLRNYRGSDIHSRSNEIKKYLNSICK